MQPWVRTNWSYQIAPANETNGTQAANGTAEFITQGDAMNDTLIGNMSSSATGNDGTAEVSNTTAGTILNDISANATSIENSTTITSVSPDTITSTISANATTDQELQNGSGINNISSASNSSEAQILQDLSGNATTSEATETNATTPIETTSVPDVEPVEDEVKPVEDSSDDNFVTRDALGEDTMSQGLQNLHSFWDSIYN
jgi:hypothetical protein